ncbi:MAG: HD domain-containing protein [Clostridiales bacterium]|nr:HD domain-containing protein [Clostridiales bacterium]
MHIVVKRTKALSNAVAATISTISSMLELRDPYTAGHNRGVGNLSVDIAQKLGLKKSVCNALLIAGYLHDIGKISIPSEILSKPEKITNLEFQIIKTHVQTSYEILSKANLDWNVAEIVYNHHERLDGSGYPRGISGDNLNIESRILMVADVVEAMLSHRPYRPSHSIEIVIEELKKKNGAVYDKKIVDIVEEMFCMDGYRISEEDVMKEAILEL